VYTATEAVGGREIAQRVDRPVCVIFSYTIIMSYVILPLPKRVSFTLPRARATFCFLARLIHIILVYARIMLYSFLSGDYAFHRCCSVVNRHRNHVVSSPWTVIGAGRFTIGVYYYCA
jgi:hypothetical protein